LKVFLGGGRVTNDDFLVTKRGGLGRDGRGEKGEGQDDVEIKEDSGSKEVIIRRRKRTSSTVGGVGESIRGPDSGERCFAEESEHAREGGGRSL